MKSRQSATVENRKRKRADVLARLCVGACSLTLALPGCSNVSQGRRAATVEPPRTDYNVFAGDQQARLRQELLDSREEIIRLEEELRSREEIQRLAEQRVENFREENQRLHAELTGVVMNSASGRGGAGVITPVGASSWVGLELPAKTHQRLSAIADNHEGIEYDRAMRTFRLQSFAAFLDDGDRLRPEARAAIKELAEALNERDVVPFNLQIVGHAGASTVSPELVAQHPTAWHLAAHQAIAVEQFLEEQGVSAVRMGTVSYANQQPLTEGDDEATRRRNGRVEIYILPPDPPAD